jgi:hypothetical protein
MTSATKHFGLFAGVSLFLCACNLATPTPVAARLPMNAFGSNGDEDIAALNLSSWAFAMSSNTRDRPVEAARAVAAVDYLSAALYAPRWEAMSPVVKYQMLAARHEVRRALGVAPGASSQAVVNALMRVADAMSTGDVQAAQKALQGPEFSLPPAETLRRLSDLPFLTAANIATQNAAAEAYPNGEGCIACN